MQSLGSDRKTKTLSTRAYSTTDLLQPHNWQKRPREHELQRIMRSLGLSIIKRHPSQTPKKLVVLLNLLMSCLEKQYQHNTLTHDHAHLHQVLDHCLDLTTTMLSSPDSITMPFSHLCLVLSQQVSQTKICSRYRIFTPPATHNHWHPGLHLAVANLLKSYHKYSQSLSTQHPEAMAPILRALQFLNHPPLETKLPPPLILQQTAPGDEVATLITISPSKVIDNSENKAILTFQESSKSAQTVVTARLKHIVKKLAENRLDPSTGGLIPQKTPVQPHDWELTIAEHQYTNLSTWINPDYGLNGCFSSIDTERVRHKVIYEKALHTLQTDMTQRADSTPSTEPIKTADKLQKLMTTIHENIENLLLPAPPLIKIFNHINHCLLAVHEELKKAHDVLTQVQLTTMVESFSCIHYARVYAYLLPGLTVSRSGHKQAGLPEDLPHNALIYKQLVSQQKLLLELHQTRDLQQKLHALSAQVNLTFPKQLEECIFSTALKRASSVCNMSIYANYLQNYPSKHQTENSQNLTNLIQALSPTSTPSLLVNATTSMFSSTAKPDNAAASQQLEKINAKQLLHVLAILLLQEQKGHLDQALNTALPYTKNLDITYETIQRALANYKNLSADHDKTAQAMAKIHSRLNQYIDQKWPPSSTTATTVMFSIQRIDSALTYSDQTHITDPNARNLIALNACQDSSRRHNPALDPLGNLLRPETSLISKYDDPTDDTYTPYTTNGDAIDKLLQHHYPYLDQSQQQKIEQEFRLLFALNSTDTIGSGTILFNCDQNESLLAFASRIDCLFAATFIAISPQHPLAIKAAQDNAKIAAFIEDKQTLPANTTRGIATNLNALHPLTNAPLPIWIASHIDIAHHPRATVGIPSMNTLDKKFADQYRLTHAKAIHTDEAGSTQIIIDPVFASVHNLPTLLSSQHGRNLITATLKQKIAANNIAKIEAINEILLRANRMNNPLTMHEVTISPSFTPREIIHTVLQSMFQHALFNSFQEQEEMLNAYINETTKLTALEHEQLDAVIKPNTPIAAILKAFCHTILWTKPRIYPLLPQADDLCPSQLYQPSEAIKVYVTNPQLDAVSNTRGIMTSVPALYQACSISIPAGSALTSRRISYLTQELSRKEDPRVEGKKHPNHTPHPNLKEHLIVIPRAVADTSVLTRVANLTTATKHIQPTLSLARQQQSGHHPFWRIQFYKNTHQHNEHAVANPVAQNTRTGQYHQIHAPLDNSSFTIHISNQAFNQAKDVPACNNHLATTPAATALILGPTELSTIYAHSLDNTFQQTLQTLERHLDPNQERNLAILCADNLNNLCDNLATLKDTFENDLQLPPWLDAQYAPLHFTLSPKQEMVFLQCLINHWKNFLDPPREQSEETALWQSDELPSDLMGLARLATSSIYNTFSGRKPAPKASASLAKLIGISGKHFRDAILVMHAMKTTVQLPTPATSLSP